MTIELQHLTDMEKRIVKVFNKRFEDHVILETVIHENTQRIVNNHDRLLIGPNGDEGLRQDVAELNTSFKVLNTKMKTWYTIASLFIGSGGLFLIYTILTGG